MAFHGPHIRFFSNSSNLWQVHTIPYLQTLQCCTFVSKTAAREVKLGPSPDIPYCLEIPSLNLLPQLAAVSNQGMRYTGPGSPSVHIR